MSKDAKGAVKTATKKSNPKRWLILFATLTSFVISNIDSGGVITQITPNLVSEFNPDQSVVVLLGSISTMVMASVMLGSGILGDIFGQKKLIMVGALVAFGAAIAAFFTPNAATLIPLRGLAGLGAGLSNPMIPAIIMLTFTPDESPTAYGLYMVGASIAGSLGALLIQYVNVNFGWRTVFLLVAFLCLFCFLMVGIFVPSQKTKKNKHIDFPGIIMAGMGFFGIVLGTSMSSRYGIGNLRTWLPVLSGGLILIVMVFYSSKVKNPAVDVDMFRNPVFAFSMILVIILYFTMGCNYFVTVYGITAAGIDPMQMSTYGIAFSISSIAAGLLAGPIAKSVPTHITISIGTFTLAVGLCLLSFQYKQQMNWPLLYLSALIMGFNASMANSHRMQAALNEVPDEKAGIGSSLNQTCGWFGISLAVAVTSAIYPTISSTIFQKLTGEAGINADPISNWNAVPSQAEIIPFWAEAWGAGIRTVLLGLAGLLFILAILSYFMYQKKPDKISA